MVFVSDEFELKFHELNRAELKRLKAESSRAGAFQFSSQSRAENMYLNNHQTFQVIFCCMITKINFQMTMEKVTSRVELKILQLELWLEPAQLGLITSLCHIRSYFSV